MDRKYSVRAFQTKALEKFFVDVCGGEFPSVTTDEFLSFFPGSHLIQTFSDTADKKIPAQMYHFKGKMSIHIHKVLMSENQKGSGIYFCVNETDGKGRRIENVKTVRSAFADLDGAPLGVALEYKPTVVVESSPGKYHCYWISNDIPAAGFPTLQKNIARAIGSDPVVNDLSRVMRVPGFFHRKGDPFLVNVCGGSGAVFTYRELVDWFPPIPVKPWQKRYSLYSVKHGDQFSGHYGTQEGSRNAHVLKIIGGMLKRGCSWDYIESEAYKDGRSSVPPLEDREIAKILWSAKRYDRR